MRGFSLAAASGGHSSARCAGPTLSRPLLLWSTGSRCTGSAAVAHGPSCSAAYGIFPDQGSNPCPLHWQADCQPLHHQGSSNQVHLSKLWNKHWYNKINCRLCSDSSSFSTDVFFPVSGSNPEYYIVFMVTRSIPVCDSFSVFPCLLWPWHF